MSSFLGIGHRGAAGYEPENTLRSIRKALELGAKAVEIDVYQVEGHLIVIHDSTLERTTNGRGRVMRKTFAQLRTLDAGKGEQIPTLEEVLDLVDRRALVNVELKGRHTALPVKALIDHYVKRRGWSHEDFLVSSFQHRELTTLAHSGIPLGILFSKSPRHFAKLASLMGATSINLCAKHVTSAAINRAHDLGLKVFVYTVNAPADISRLREMGVDGVFSDFPDRVRD